MATYVTQLWWDWIEGIFVDARLIHGFAVISFLWSS